MSSAKSKLYIILTLLVALSLACASGTNGEAPVPNPPAAEEKSPLSDYWAGTEFDGDGPWQVNFTEDEFNQMLAWTQEQSTEVGAELPVQNAQVHFQNGSVSMTGTLGDLGEINIGFGLTVVNGALQVEVTSAIVGGIPVPAAVFAPAEAVFNETINQFTSEIPSGLTLQSVTISEGTLSVVLVRV